MAVADLVINIITKAGDAQKGLDATATKASKMGAGIQKAAAPAALALAGIGAAAVSAGKAAAEDAQSQAILANALRNNAGASDDAIASVEEHIAAMANATGVADDQLRPALGNLVRATGDADKAQSLLASSMDVAAATGTDVETVSKAMAKASKGSTGALKKLVPGLDDATLASGDMVKIQEDLAKQVGGASADAADTAAGKMAIMQNSMAEAEESIGTALLPVMSLLADKLAAVAGWVQENSKLVGIIVGVVAAFAAVILLVNAAMSIYGAVTAIAAVAQMALFWPILLIIAGIIALIAVIVLVVKHWDTIKRVALQVWNSIKAATAAVVAWLKQAWTSAMQAVATAVRWVQSVFRAVWNAIRAAVSAVANAVKAVWATVFGWIRGAVSLVRAGFTAQFNLVKSVVGKVADAVKSAWRKVFDALKSAVGGVVDTLRKPFDAVAGAIDTVISAIKRLIDWFGRIKVPKISLPKIPGFNSAATVSAPVSQGAARGLGAPLAAGTRASASSGVTVVIQGAVDPESTARQVRRLLASHDRRMGGSAGLHAGLV